MAKKEISDQARRIRILRKFLNLTMPEFGNKMGEVKQTVYKWENGDNNPPWDLPLRLHQIFGVSYDWWYSGVGSKIVTEGKKTLITDLNQVQLEIEFMRKETEELKGIILKLVKDFYAEKNEKSAK